MILPLTGGSNPRRVARRVVLPVPLEPTKATREPHEVCPQFEQIPIALTYLPTRLRTSKFYPREIGPNSVPTSLPPTPISLGLEKIRRQTIPRMEGNTGPWHTHWISQFGEGLRELGGHGE